MIEKPPNWQEYLNRKTVDLALSGSERGLSFLKKAQSEYVYWEKFKHYPIPEGFSPEEAWAAIKIIRRTGTVATPVVSIEGNKFKYLLTNALLQRLNYIDTKCAGNVRGDDVAQPSKREEVQLILSGLSEEAIASSQMEGASTSRKVAKKMIYSKRKPRTKDEQMIMNNFSVMESLEEWKDLDLSLSMLLDIQKKITAGTLDDEGDSGRFRRDVDEIKIFERSTGELLFVPPNEKMLDLEIGRLIEYANSRDSDFVHPVIKACILHFWVAYLHPFVDGNGRTARAIFYWYLMKNDYWLFKYLSVSRVIKQQRRRYDRAFLYAEHDDEDLTYFLDYKSSAIVEAIDDFMEHLEKKRAEAEEVTVLADKSGVFSERQINLLLDLRRGKEGIVDITSYQHNNGVAYETARADLMKLVDAGLMIQEVRGKKFVFVPNVENLNKFFNTLGS